MGKLTLETAKNIIKGAEKEAININVPMVISIVDEGGNLVAVERMDDAWLGSVDIAQGKAFTAVAFKLETEVLANITVPNTELYGLNTTNKGKIVVFGGGIPLFEDGKLVGAIGVSGGAVSEDIQVATAGAKVFNK